MSKQSKTRFPEKLLVSMPVEMRRRLTQKAVQIGQTDTEFVRQAIRSALGMPEITRF